MTVYRFMYTETETEIESKNSKGKQISDSRIKYYPPKPPFLNKKGATIIFKQLSECGTYTQNEHGNSEEWSNRKLFLTGDISVQKSEDNGKTWREFSNDIH